jgi:hypothetical protein
VTQVQKKSKAGWRTMLHACHVPRHGMMAEVQSGEAGGVAGAGACASAGYGVCVRVWCGVVHIAYCMSYHTQTRGLRRMGVQRRMELRTLPRRIMDVN